MRRIVGLVAVSALAVGMMGLGLGAATASGGSAAPAAQAARCDEGHWPATVQGRPESFRPGGTAGYYIWHDSYGWHLRTTTPSPASHLFSGKIVSSDKIKVVRQFKDEAPDRVRVEGGVVSFRFDTHNGVDGIDFLVGCTESVTFLLKLEGHWIPADRIFLGRTGHARSSPFTVYRIG